MSRRKPPPRSRGKGHHRRPDMHKHDADKRWRAVTENWPNLETGAAPDGAPRALPGPGGNGGQKGLKGDTA
jgi:hypothetical protein